MLNRVPPVARLQYRSITERSNENGAVFRKVSPERDELLFLKHPSNEMLQAPKCNDNAFRLSGAAAGEQNIKWVIALRTRWQEQARQSWKIL